MDVTLRRMSVPTHFDKLALGSAFSLHHEDGRTWQAIKIAAAADQRPTALILAGPEVHGATFPAIIDPDAIGGTVAQMENDGFIAAPDDAKTRLQFGQSGGSKHGALLVEEGGELWIVLNNGHGQRGGISLKSGVSGKPKAAVLCYPSWRLCIMRGQHMFTLALFNPPDPAEGANEPSATV